DRRLGLSPQSLRPQNQIAAGHIETAGDTEATVFLRRSHIEDDQIGDALLQISKFFGGNFWNGSFMMNLFSKGFARHINSADRRVSLLFPSRQPTVEDCDIVTEFF